MSEITPGQLKTMVDLAFRATDVPSYDTFSPSDPVCVLYQKLNNTSGSNYNRGQQQLKVGRTEPLLDDANPIWTQKIRVNYEFEALQQFKLCVYDVDDIKALDNLDKQELIGYVEFTMSQLMSSPNSTLKLEVWKENSTTEKHKKMRLTIQAFEVVDSRLWCKGRVRATGLKQHGLFTQDDTSFEICKKMSNGVVNVCYSSATVLKNNKNPQYEAFEVGLGQVLCGVDDLSTEMTCRVVRVRRNDYKQRVVIGEVTKPISDFVKAVEAPEKGWELRSADGKNLCTGRIFFDFFTIEQQPTFIDFVKGGLQFRFCVMIDATASNSSNGGRNLHALGGNNDYQRAINAVGSVLASYTKSQSIHAIGYGAECSVDGKPRETSFCFPLTLSTQRWEVRDVAELLYAYDYCFKNIRLSGPTYFAPGIQHFAELSKVAFTPTFQLFTIVLVLTDGLCNDMQKTIDAIVESSSYPIAIVICGIGSTDWANMNLLDGDGDARLTSQTTGKKSVIDNVQFFPINECGNDPSAIAAATLAEIPHQVLQFMKYHNIKPMEIPQFNRLSTSGGYQPPPQQE